jgi:hypothetical protein
MTILKNLLAGLSALGIFAAAANAQVIRDDQIHPGTSPANPKSMPPQSPASPTSSGAIIIKYKAELLDKDRDGKVSKVEAGTVPELTAAFDKLDRDRDGRLDQVELDAFTK